MICGTCLHVGNKSKRCVRLKTTCTVLVLKSILQIVGRVVGLVYSITDPVQKCSAGSDGARVKAGCGLGLVGSSVV